MCGESSRKTPPFHRVSVKNSSMRLAACGVGVKRGAGSCFEVDSLVLMVFPDSLGCEILIRTGLSRIS